MGPHVLLPHHPHSHFLSDSLALAYFHSIKSRQRHTGAIYRRVVLFYQPVSICVAQKYRGLPVDVSSAALQRWGLCEIEREKDIQDKKKSLNNEVRQKGNRVESELDDI